jgi:hypothetical protein
LIHGPIYCSHVQNQHLKNLRVKRHNEATHTIRHMLLSQKSTRCLTLMNVGKFQNQPPDNTVPIWLLPCHCNNRCQCNARLRLDVICIKPLPHLSEQTPSINDGVTIQFIEFTYCHDRIFEDKIQIKKDKYNAFIDELQNNGWNVPPLIVITAGPRGIIHTTSEEILKEQLQLHKNAIKKCMTDISTIAIQYLSSLILNKKKIENNQPMNNP